MLMEMDTRQICRVSCFTRFLLDKYPSENFGGLVKILYFNQLKRVYIAVFIFFTYYGVYFVGRIHWDECKIRYINCLTLNGNKRNKGKLL